MLVQQGIMLLNQLTFTYFEAAIFVLNFITLN
jgi:hypothetical protein